MKILHLNDYLSGYGGSEVVMNNIVRVSSHEGEISTFEDAQDLDSYDLIHVHNVWSKKFDKLKGRKLIMSIHDYRLTKCMIGMRLCEAENRNCLTCRGLLGFYLNHLRIRPLWKFVDKQSPTLVVHSPYMKDYYKPKFDTTYMPIPLEVKDMNPSDNREDYLFFSARCSNEKNPFAFARMCKEIGVKGVMALTISNTYFKSYMRQLQKFPNIEVFIEPEFKEQIDLYRHAKLTVHPYKYAEPFGISCVNSILCGTPLLSYPYGNLPHVSTLTAYGYESLKNMVIGALESPVFYEALVKKTLEMRQKFVEEFDCGKRWDNFYEGLA